MGFLFLTTKQLPVKVRLQDSATVTSLTCPLLLSYGRGHEARAYWTLDKEKVVNLISLGETAEKGGLFSETCPNHHILGSLIQNGACSLYS